MFKKTLAFVSFSFFVIATYSQGDGFDPPAGFQTDYSHVSEAIPGKCAQFSAKENSFYYYHKKGKPGLQIDLPSGDGGVTYLVQLADNKKLKLKSRDIILIQDALEVWDEKKVQIQVEQITKQKFSAGELEAFSYETEDSGLGIHIIEQGSGPLPEKGKPIKVHYRGYLTDGSVFDASYDRGNPFQFPLGIGRVIKGWDLGIAQLPVGTRALLKIPPEMGYGSRSAGSIPANSTLIFDVFVLGN